MLVAYTNKLILTFSIIVMYQLGFPEHFTALVKIFLPLR